MVLEMGKDNFSPGDPEQVVNEAKMHKLQLLQSYMIICQAYSAGIQHLKKHQYSRENKEFVFMIKPVLYKSLDLQHLPYGPLWLEKYMEVVKELEPCLKIIFPHWDEPLKELKGGE